MKTKYFLGFIISFAIGVALQSILDFGYSFVLFCAILGIVTYLTGRVVFGSRSVLCVSLFFVGLSVGALRVDVSLLSTPQHTLGYLAGKVLEIEGVIVDEPDVREEYTNIVFETENVLGSAEPRLGRKINSARILLRVPAYPKLWYGDKIIVVGKITNPKNLTSKDNLRTFDYRSYLAKDGIYYQMYFPRITVVSKGNGNFIREKLFAFKTLLLENISSDIPEPEASLASGITLGAKQSLGNEIIQKFRDTGVAHIVVLSGYNIAVVAGIISRLVVFMPFSMRLIMSALGIVLFALMVGGGATVVRATIMALVIILARVLGREGDALRALFLAGGLMVFLNPMILLYDVSFQLSFVATLAIVTFVPVIERFFLFITSRVLREIIITTIATQIFVMPIILYHTGSTSLVGFVTNIFVLPVVPLAMFFVALVSLFAWAPVFGSVFALLAYGLLKYIFLVVDIFSRVPFASISNVAFSLPALGVTYLFFGLLFYFLYDGRAIDVAIKK